MGSGKATKEQESHGCLVGHSNDREGKVQGRPSVSSPEIYAAELLLSEDEARFNRSPHQGVKGPSSFRRIINLSRSPPNLFMEVVVQPTRTPSAKRALPSCGCKRV